MRYGGVDRGMCQINSAANATVTWLQSFTPTYAIGWSAKRLRDYFGLFTQDYPSRPTAMRWDAAVCAHNSPARAYAWLKNGYPSGEAAAYVAAVKNARY